jgi:hypothetical protein
MSTQESHEKHRHPHRRAVRSRERGSGWATGGSTEEEQPVTSSIMLIIEEQLPDGEDPREHITTVVMLAREKFKDMPRVRVYGLIENGTVRTAGMFDNMS